MPVDESRYLTESRVAEELGLDRLELYLAAAQQKIGRYDSLTHLMVFTDEEVDTLARRLGITRRKKTAPGESQRRIIPEPTSE